MTDAGCERDALGWRGMVVVAGKKADVCSSVTMDEDPLEPSRLLPTRRFPICNDLVTGLDPSSVPELCKLRRREHDTWMGPQGFLFGETFTLLSFSTHRRRFLTTFFMTASADAQKWPRALYIVISPL